MKKLWFALYFLIFAALLSMLREPWQSAVIRILVTIVVIELLVTAVYLVLKRVVKHNR